MQCVLLSVPVQNTLALTFCSVVQIKRRKPRKKISRTEGHLLPSCLKTNAKLLLNRYTKIVFDELFLTLFWLKE